MSRDVTVRLSAEISSYVSSMDQARRATDQAAESADSLATSASGVERSASGMAGATGQMRTASDQAAQATERAATATDHLGTSAQGAAGSVAGVGLQSQSATTGMLGVSQAAQDGQRNVDHFGQTMDSAGDSIGGAMSLSGGFSGAVLDIASSMGRASERTGDFFRMAASMRQEFTTTGAVLAGAGAGITALGTSLINTGIQYNTLQQVAGRAMETMTGSAEAAANQMDRLHEFADTSPFARDVWITAQQQLMAFGMEAEDVVPTLEGVQNAVAAIGGGDQEIMQLVDILGQVEGQGKITGRELQRLGQMGINAADLIGEAMGVSGNEIREQITAGALDADVAITALTEGMMTRFGGAAEGLRDTMSGALDRIRARVRDLGSIIATPLVNPSGGGFLVDAINQVADFGTALLGLPDPLLQIVGLGGTAVGVLATLGGGFLILAPRVGKTAVQMWETFNAMREFVGSSPRAISAIRNFGIAAGVAAVAIAGLMIMNHFTDSADEFAASSARMGQELLKAAEGGEAFANIDWERGYAGEESVNSLGDAMDRVTNAGFLDGINRITASLGLAGGVVTDLDANFESMDQSMTAALQRNDYDHVVEGFKQVQAAGEEMGLSTTEILELFPTLSDTIMESATAAGHAASGQEVLAVLTNDAALAALMAGESWDFVTDLILQGGDAAYDAGEGMVYAGDQAQNSEGGIRGFGGAMESMAEAAGEASSRLDEIVDSYTALGLVQVDAETQIMNYNAALRDLDEQLKETGNTLADNTDEGKQNWESMVGLGQQAWDTAAAMAETGSSVDDVTKYLYGMQDELAGTIEGMTISGEQADRLGDSFGWSAERIAELGEGMGLSAEEAEDLAGMLTLIPEEVSSEFDFIDEFGREAVNSVLELLEGFPEELHVWFEAQDQNVQDAIVALIERDYEAQIDLLGDPSSAEIVMEAFLNDDYETIAEILGVDDDARAVIHALETGNYEAVADILGDDGHASAVIDAFTRGDYEAIAKILGDDDNAVATINDYMGRDYWTTVNVDGNGGPFLTDVRTLETGNYNATIQANASTWTAETQLNNAARTRYSTIQVTIQENNLLRNSSSSGPYADWRGQQGGRVGWSHLPSFSGGGRLPYTGLGTDKILGINSKGQPSAWVDDEEWIVNKRSSDKYHRALAMINSDHPAVRHLAGFAEGGRPSSVRGHSVSSGGSSGAGALSAEALSAAMSSARPLVGSIQASGSDPDAIVRSAIDQMFRILQERGVPVGSP